MFDDRYVQRNGAETLHVFINPDTREGDLEEGTPSICLTDTHGGFYLMLTWREARDLIKAIGEVESISRVG